MLSKFATAAAAGLPAAGGRFAPRLIHRHLLVTALLALWVFFSSAGNATEFRTLKIAEGRFEQSEITAPAGAPLILEIELFGPRDVTVSIPELGIEPTVIPTNQIRIGSVHESSRDLATARIALGTVSPGTYEILCSCYGRPATARLVVE